MPRSRSPTADFWGAVAVAVHVVFLAVYGVIYVLLALLAADSFTLDSSDSAFFAEIFAGGWLLFAGGLVWLLVPVALVRWWQQGRAGLVKRALAWDSLLWAGLFLVLLLPWKRSRRLLVPPPVR